MRGWRPKGTWGSPEHDNRILVTLLSPIGDTLFATPAIHLLRHRFPRAYIAALAFPTNQGILTGNPDLDQVFIHPTLQWWPGWTYHRGLLQRLRALHFDLAVDLCTAFWVTRLLMGPRQRTRLCFAPGWWLVPHRQEGATHAVYHYLKALEPLGLWEPAPKLHLALSPEERDFARAFVRARGVGADALLIAIHPGGEGFGGKKRWRAEGFAALGKALSRRWGARTLLLGGNSDREIAHWVAERIGRQAINGTGATTLKETAALVEQCHLFIGNDSSPLHMAAAVGTPVVGIYGPSNPSNFYPFGVRHAVVQGRRPCAPCFHFVGTVPLWQRAFCRSCLALEGISEEEVMAAAESMLSASEGRRASPEEPSPLMRDLPPGASSTR